MRCCQLAGMLAERGDLDAARRAYTRGRARASRSLLRARSASALTLPMVYADAPAVAARAAYRTGSRRLERRCPRWSADARSPT